MATNPGDGSATAGLEESGTRAQSQIRFIYVVAPSMDVARALGRAVVEKRLAACANAWPGVESIYRWNGAVETAHECALIVKTTSDRVEAARAELAALHPYETPCLLDFAICGGNAAYLRWIEGQIA